MSLAIEITNLRKNYKDAYSPALDGLSLQVEKNLIMGLLGPNGAGKTTCISILCGLVMPDSGDAFIFGKDCIKNTVAIRSMIGVVPQQIALFGNLTGWENFIYIGRLYGLSDKKIKGKAKELLVKLGLEKHADKRINRYSGGMKRRANIIASLLHEPELLILDEPTAGVDVQSRAMIIDFLKEYHNQGKTILYTSHLMEEAEKLCDKVVIIDEGKFVVSGSPIELVSQTDGCKNLEEVFLYYTGHSVRD
ncbi:MAG TPA: ABC transporter ATP-binding protein [Flavipsychrobacter sp.]|nr:ABC transporter ATP-binding protein [Flavipsychrobacter sp.]